MDKGSSAGWLLFPLLNLTFGCHDLGSFPRVLAVLNHILSAHSAYSTKKYASKSASKTIFDCVELLSWELRVLSFARSAFVKCRHRIELSSFPSIVTVIFQFFVSLFEKFVRQFATEPQPKRLLTYIVKFSSNTIPCISVIRQ